MTDNCPHRNTSLIGKPIPATDRRHFGGKQFFRREILVEAPEIYDGGLYYQCPDCSGTFHRWSEDGGWLAKTLRNYAEPYIHGPTEEPC